MGIGTRVLNGLIDTILVFILAFILYKWYSFYVFYYRWYGRPFYIFFYLSMFLYYFVAELAFGRTVGKLVTLTQVVNKQGASASFLQILARSILRLTLIYPFSIPFLQVPLHDYLTKTRLKEV
ncbi:MAG: hypothetical protein EAY68_09915 [Bacteroidetes bacterium]|nr:MAG: hypothetical protein EAY68_09915 [Bacteroidota bacterium]